jgi:hypothetical protein
LLRVISLIGKICRISLPKLLRMFLLQLISSPVEPSMGI